MCTKISQISAIAILSAITVLLSLLFLNKPFHIDDPLFVWTARQIQEHPADPYGFLVNWSITEEWMWRITKNPPLTSYYIALASRLLGWTERALHFAFILPAVAAITGTYVLAARLCRRPALAAALALLNPVFLVSSSTVMCDVMMLAFWVWAMFFWIDGMEKNNRAMLLFSVFLASLCALTKYFGISLVPLLFAYTLFKGRVKSSLPLYFLLPAAVLLLYRQATAAYGRDLLMDAFNFSMRWQNYFNIGAALKGAVGLAFLGGCIGSIMFYLPYLWPKWSLVLQGMFFICIFLFLYSIGWIGRFPLYTIAGTNWGQLFQFCVLALLGLNVLALVVTDLFANKADADSSLLFLWAWGAFLFLSFLNWVANGRSVLPMVPAVAVLMVRQMDRVKTAATGSYLVLIPALVFSLLISGADYGLAQSARQAAKVIHEKYNGTPANIWFEGHWGFQYYMQSEGARILDKNDISLKSGDVVVIPENNDSTFKLPDYINVASVDTIELRPFPLAVTMSRLSGAGFYASGWGPLPFVFGPPPPERYDILTIGPRKQAR